MFNITIRKAIKQDSAKAAVLIYDAIDDIANVLTGEKEKQKVLKRLELYFSQEVNRLSYHNCLVKIIDDEPVGIAIAYHGKDSWKLDESIREYLKNITSKEVKLDSEADVADYYLDTLSVNPLFGGQGIGTDLLNGVIYEAKEQGYRTISLNVDKKNVKARKLYEKMDFVYKKSIKINNHYYDYLVKCIF